VGTTLQLAWAWVLIESSWNVTAHGNAREGKWRGNWRMEWVASTLHTTSEHGVSSIITADAHTSAASSRLNWRPPADLNGLVRFAENEIWFLRVCHHIWTGLYELNVRKWPPQHALCCGCPLTQRRICEQRTSDGEWISKPVKYCPWERIQCFNRGHTTVRDVTPFDDVASG